MDGLVAYVGTLVHSLNKQHALQIQTNSVIGVRDGKIVFIEPKENLLKLQTQFSFSHEQVVLLPDRTFLMPGMIDTHTHPSQFPNCGIGLDLPLRDWLTRYTYPIEVKCDGDPDFATECYSAAVHASIRNGTTTVNYFPTLGLNATRILSEIVGKSGQRAFIGVSCKNSKIPENYTQTVREAVQNSRVFIQETHQRNNPRIRAGVLPRSAFSCDERLLMELGQIAKEYDVLIHTHMNEIVNENLGSCPQYLNCTELFAGCGLLTSKTILAHCVHMEDKELDVLSKVGVSVAHCPNSNLSLQSGFCNVRRLWEAGIKVGLSTDVSGGYTVSMLDAMRSAIQTSKILQITKEHQNCEEALSFKDVFYLATLGGAEALSIDDQVGNFMVGKSFDALLIDLNKNLSGGHIFSHDSQEEIVQKFIMLGDDRNISKVYVEGQCIHSK